MRVLIIILAVAQFLLAGFVAGVGGFADGGTVWERAVLMGVQPIAAIGLLVMAFVPRISRAGVTIVMALLSINIVADVALSVAIWTGVIRGDWWLPLVFVVIPVIGLIYGGKRLSAK